MPNRKRLANEIGCCQYTNGSGFVIVCILIVMRRRKLFIVVASVVLVLAVMTYLLGRRRDASTLQAAVLAYDYSPGGMRDIICADTEFYVPPNCSMDLPRFELSIQTQAGWRRQDAATMGPTVIPLNLRPAGKNRATFVLPADALRWRLIIKGRKAGLRLRFFNQISSSTGSWAHDSSMKIRPVWLWVGRQLPNTLGGAVHLESELLPVHSKRLRLRSPHNQPGTVNGGKAILLHVVRAWPAVTDPDR